jgi:hypothetical protein
MEAVGELSILSDLTIIPPEAMEELAKVLTHGATKYEDHNWARGMKWSRVFAALMRHMWSWWKGESVDPETGYSHLSHALCNLVFLVTYEQRKMKQFDDRFIGPMYRAEIRPWDDVSQGRQGERTLESEFERWLRSSCAYG